MGRDAAKACENQCFRCRKEAAKHNDKFGSREGAAELDLDRIIPREIDLTTLDGCTLYGKLNVKAAPLTLDEARRYASRIPNADSWYWLATGWSGPLKGDKGRALYVNSSGDWSGGFCSSSCGIRPALKIPSDLLHDSADKPDLSEVPTDTLLEKIRRRVVGKA